MARTRPDPGSTAGARNRGRLAGIGVLALVLAALPAGAGGDTLRTLGAPAGDLAGLVSRGLVAVAPPAEAWLSAARTGEPLTLTLGARTLEVSLHPNDALFVRGAGVRDVAGRDLGTSGIHPLAGGVAGAPDATVRVTVFGENVAGALWGPGVGHLAVGPGSEGAPLIADVTAVRTLPAVALDNHDPIYPPGGTFYGCTRPIPYAIASPQGLTAGWPERTIEIAFAVDDPFVQLHGAGGWAGAATAIANGMDGLYTSEINLRVQIADLHAHGSEVLTAGNTNGLLNQLRAHYQEDHTTLERDATHLFVGRNLVEGGAGAAGQASCIGAAGDPDAAWSVGMATGLGDNGIDLLGFTFYGDAYLKIAAHEIGHLLSAHHHYANCVEAAGVYSPSRPADACTLMFNSLDTLSLSFSTVNRLVMRGWADGADL